MLYNCLIVDDEQPARRLLENYCSKLKTLKVIGSFKSVIEAIPVLESDSIDILFLDIQMPDITGIDYLKTLHNTNTQVVLTTAYREYALEGFELNVLDYLLKPIAFSRFVQTIQKLKTVSRRPENFSEEDTIFLKSNKKTYRVAQNDIHYIKSENEYLTYYTKTYGAILVLGALKQLADTLNNNFIRVHRSFVVNLSHIDYLEGNRLHVSDSFVPMSDTYKKEFLERWR